MHPSKTLPLILLTFLAGAIAAPAPFIPDPAYAEALREKYEALGAELEGLAAADIPAPPVVK